ncbi:MAG: hypothetical protein C0404_13955, partial [Verrucomicrobia bacterium]|nr:hypothetical protein [Verrucomicrobiota bacterium]
FAAAAGLALAGLEIETSSLSLLPSDLRDEMTFKQHKPFWVAAAVTAALILCVSVAGGYYESARMEKHKQGQLASIRARQQLKAEIETLKDRNEQINDVAKPLRAMLDSGPLMRDLLTLVADARSRNDAITVICDSDAYFRSDLLSVPTPQQVQAARKERRRGVRPIDQKLEKARIDSVIIEGFTRTYNLSSVKRLISRLNSAPFVEAADLLSDDRLAPLDSDFAKAIAPGTTRFAIEVKLKRQ